MQIDMMELNGETIEIQHLCIYEIGKHLNYGGKQQQNRE